MTERTVFECDFSGDRFGAKNDVIVLPEKRRSATDPFQIHESDLHLSIEALDDEPVTVATLQNIKFIATQGREIIGSGVSLKADSRSTDRYVEYRPRGDVLTQSNEAAFEWLEEEVL